jgi:hypothetical protein
MIEFLYFVSHSCFMIVVGMFLYDRHGRHGRS